MPDLDGNDIKILNGKSVIDVEESVIDVEETGKYFVDRKGNICKEIIHIIPSVNGRIRICIFRKINIGSEIDLGVFGRIETNMTHIPEDIVKRMHIV